MLSELVAVPGATGPESGIDANLVTLIATAVGASVFTIGFHTHRVHAALLAASDKDSPEEARQMVDDARGHVALAVNLVIVAGVWVAIVLALAKWDVQWFDVFVLVGLGLLELAIVGLGFIEDRGAAVTAERRYGRPARDPGAPPGASPR